MAVASSSPNDYPTEEDLQKCVVKKIGKEWKSVCTYLGIPSHEIDTASQDNMGNVKVAFFNLLVWWRNGNVSEKPATWSVLKKALKEAGRPDIAKECDTAYRILGGLGGDSSCDIWHPLVVEYYELCETILKDFEANIELNIEEITTFCKFLLKSGRKSNIKHKAEEVLDTVVSYRHLLEVILIMTKWMNFSFLERIVQKFPSGPSVSALEDYKTKLRPVLKEKVKKLWILQKKSSESPPPESGSGKNLLTELAVSYNYDSDGITLEEILESQNFMHSSLGISKHLLQIFRVLSGSVVVVYQTLVEFESDILERLDQTLQNEVKMAEFARSSVISITIANRVFDILQITNERKLLVVQALQSSLSQKWEHFADILSQFKTTDPLPTNYPPMVADQRAVYGNQENVTYLEWLLLHGLPEVVRRLSIDPWALLLVMISQSEQDSSLHQQPPKEVHRTVSLVTDLFMCDFDQIEAVFKKISKEGVTLRAEEEKSKGMDHIARELKEIGFTQESSKIEASVSAMNNGFNFNTSFASLLANESISDQLFNPKGDFFQNLFVAIKNEGSYSETFIKELYFRSSAESPYYYIKDLDKAYMMVLEDIEATSAHLFQEARRLVIAKRGGEGLPLPMYTIAPFPSSIKPAALSSSMKPAALSSSMKPAALTSSMKPAALTSSMKPTALSSSMKPAALTSSMKPAALSSSMKPAAQIDSEGQGHRTPLQQVRRQFKQRLDTVMQPLPNKETTRRVLNGLKAFNTEDSLPLLFPSEQEKTGFDLLNLCHWYESGFLKALYNELQPSEVTSLSGFEVRRNQLIGSHSVDECLPSGPSLEASPPPGYSILKVALAGMPNTVSMREVWRAKDVICDSLALCPHSLLLRGFQKGSVIAVFYITQRVELSKEMEEVIIREGQEREIPFYKITLLSSME